MISCKRATELMSKALEEPLTAEEARALKFHNFICEFCLQFERQIELVRGALRGQAGREEADDDSQDRMSQSAKDRLRETLKKKSS